MALKLVTATKQGVTAEYYRIESIHWIKRRGMASVTLSLYVSEAVAKTPGSQPLSSVAHALTNIGDDMGLDCCYAAIKTGCLADAEDLLT